MVSRWTNGPLSRRGALRVVDASALDGLAGYLAAGSDEGSVDVLSAGSLA